jgi:hypothetical protein
LTQAIIELGERQTMKWTISREEGARHSLVVWANKGCGDTTRRLKEVERKSHGTATYYKIPKLSSEKMNLFFFTRIKHGHRVVYLQTSKKDIIPGLKDKASTPDQEELKEILISNYNGHQKEETSEHPQSEDKAKESSEHSQCKEATSDDRNLHELMKECLKSAVYYGKKLNMDYCAILHELHLELNCSPEDDELDLLNDIGGAIDDAFVVHDNNPEDYGTGKYNQDNASIGTWTPSCPPNTDHMELLEGSSAFGDAGQIFDPNVTANSLKNGLQKESWTHSSQGNVDHPESLEGSSAYGDAGQIFDLNVTANNPLQSNDPQEPSTETNQPTQPKPTTNEATNHKLPMGSYEVEKLHAHKKRGKKKFYFVEWKEEFEGQWGPARYSWEEARDIDQASKDEFHREYKEMDSTVRESFDDMITVI